MSMSIVSTAFQWTTAVYQPGTDNAVTLGATANRWSTIYGYTVDAKTAHTTQAAAPTFSAGCGSTATGTTGNGSTTGTGSSNNAGQFITSGTGQTGVCTVTFNTAYATRAYCTVTPAASGANAITYVTSTNAAFTINSATNFSATSAYNYTCFGN